MIHTAQTRLRVSPKEAELIAELMRTHGHARRAAASKFWREGMESRELPKWISDTFGLHSRQAQSIQIGLEQIEKSWRERQFQKMQAFGRTVAYYTRLVHENAVALDEARADHRAKPSQRDRSGRRIELLKAALFRNRMALDRGIASLEMCKSALSKGRPRVCIGGKDLARERARVGKPGAAFGDLAAWRAAWDAARDGVLWIVGSGREPMGNLSCRLDPVERTLTLSLSASQAQARIDAMVGDRKAPSRIEGKMGAKRLVIHGVGFHDNEQRRLERAIEQKRPVSVRITRKPTKSGVDAFHLYATFELVDSVPVAQQSGCLGIDFNGRECSWALVDGEGNLRCVGQASDDQELASSEVVSAVCLSGAESRGRRAWCISSLPRGARRDAMGKMAAHIARLAARSGASIAIGAENYAKRAKELGQSGPARQLRASDYSAFNRAIHRAAARHGLSVLQADTTGAAVTGYAKYAQANGLSVGCAAAMLIARRAALGAPLAVQPSGKANKKGQGAPKARRSAGRRQHQERVVFPRSMPAIEQSIERRPRDSAWERIAQVMGPDQRAWRACLFGSADQPARPRFHRGRQAPPPAGDGSRAE